MERKKAESATTLVLWLCLAGCSQRSLPGGDGGPVSSRLDRLTVTGTVCTIDPRQLEVPVKVLFLIDVSQQLARAGNDLTFQRAKAVEEVVALYGKRPDLELGVVAFGAEAVDLLGPAGGGGFTRDIARLKSAIQKLHQIAPCKAGICRDIDGALARARSIVAHDIAARSGGPPATYAVVLLAGGPPVPAPSRCRCRDESQEKPGGKWAACPWVECDCDPKAPACPLRIPDTFTAELPLLEGGKCASSLTCVFPPGSPGSCEERMLVAAARDLADLARAHGDLLELHTTYLPCGGASSALDMFAPSAPCKSLEAQQARAARLMSEAAFAGGGTYEKLASAAQIVPSFTALVNKLFARSVILSPGELIVTNTSALPLGGAIGPDSDADGLADEAEAGLGTCPYDLDTDGDGLGDSVEVLLGSAPLVADSPVGCLSLKSTPQTTGPDPCSPKTVKTWSGFHDADADGINDCEERLLGTDADFHDSDADGLPDTLELKGGANPLQDDTKLDADLDGAPNKKEILERTDPRGAGTPGVRDAHAYRYRQERRSRDLRDVSRPAAIGGVDILQTSEQSSPGTGHLRFEPGPPPTLAWRDYGDMGDAGGFGPAVDVSKPGDYELVSHSPGRFLTVRARGSGAYPKQPVTEKLNVAGYRAECVEFRVGNIALVETGSGTTSMRGDNTIVVHFGFGPRGHETLFRRTATFKANYRRSPERRVPASGELTLTNADFVTALP